MTSESGPKSAGVTTVEMVSEPIEQETYTMLVRAASRLEAELNRVFRPMDLTGATYGILRILKAAGVEGLSCGDISEQLIAEVPDMTRLLDRLERLGYIARERSRTDRRMVRVTLTEKGDSVLNGLYQAVRDCHVRQLGHLGQTKLSELSMLLSIVLNQPKGAPAQERPRGAAIKHTAH
ncbi:MAG: MarR family winged helix-turn-helix transcriptional regulator [Pseudomonadota bacterium]|jgi:DNA-binding MarR family transcriptional regulator